MRIQITDPISGRDVDNLDSAPYVIEGQGEDSLKIYFNTEQNKQVYQEVQTFELGSHAVEIYNRTTGISMEM